jgi:hypothetical protein
MPLTEHVCLHSGVLLVLSKGSILGGDARYLPISNYELPTTAQVARQNRTGA